LGNPFWADDTGRWVLSIDPIVQGNGGRGNNFIAVDKVNFRWTTTATVKCDCNGNICYRSGPREIEDSLDVPNDDENWNRFNPLSTGGLPFYSPSSISSGAASRDSESNKTLSEAGDLSLQRMRPLLALRGTSKQVEPGVVRASQSQADNIALKV
jgi:hypothetical protein